MEDSPGPSEWSRAQRTGIVLAVCAAVVVAGAVFPRLVYWRTRLGPRGQVVYAACATLCGFALRQFVLPHFRRMAEQTNRARDDLRRRLGREPTREELIEHLDLRPARETE